MAEETSESKEVIGFSRADANSLLALIGVGTTFTPRNTPSGSYANCIMRVTQTITARTGNVVGEGKARLQFIDKDKKLVAIPLLIDSVFNLGSATAAVNTLIFCVRDSLSNKLIWIYEDCG